MEPIGQGGVRSPSRAGGTGGGRAGESHHQTAGQAAGLTQGPDQPSTECQECFHDPGQGHVEETKSRDAAGQDNKQPQADVSHEGAPCPDQDRAERPRPLPGAHHREFPVGGDPGVPRGGGRQPSEQQSLDPWGESRAPARHDEHQSAEKQDNGDGDGCLPQHKALPPSEQQRDPRGPGQEAQAEDQRRHQQEQSGAGAPRWCPLTSFRHARPQRNVLRNTANPTTQQYTAKAVRRPRRITSSSQRMAMAPKTADTAKPTSS